MIHDTLHLALKALLNAQQLEHLVDRQLQREAIDEVRAELWRIDSDNSEWSNTWAQATDLVENNDQVSEALQNFAEDPTGDNAVGVVATVLEWK